MDAIDQIISNLNLAPEVVRQISFHNDTLYICNTLRGDAHQLEISDLLFQTKKVVRSVKFISKSDFEEKYKGKHTFKIPVDAPDNDIEQYIKNLIEAVYQRKGTDIHISYMGSYTRIRIRTKGFMWPYEEFDGEIGLRILRYMINSMTGGQKSSNLFNLTEQIDARIVSRKYLPESMHSIRVHTQPVQTSSEQDGGTGAFCAMRLLYDSTKAQGTLKERLIALGFTQDQCQTIHELTRRSGITIVAGPTGSGKSTLLKHILESMIEEMPEKAFFSVEDPPEYPIEGMVQFMVNTNEKDQSYDADSMAKQFEKAMGGAMRCDPNALMIGEIRYKEAANFAMHVALSGHAAWASTHADDGFGIVSRLEEMMRNEQMPQPLKSICKPGLISGLIALRLIPKLCPHCKEKYFSLSVEEREKSVPRDCMRRLTNAYDADKLQSEGKLCVRGSGCEVCDGDGFEGLTVAAEVINVDREMLTFMRNGEIEEARKYWIETKNGKSFMSHALNMITAGDVDPYAAELCLGSPLTNLL